MERRGIRKFYLGDKGSRTERRKKFCPWKCFSCSKKSPHTKTQTESLQDSLKNFVLKAVPCPRSTGRKEAGEGCRMQRPPPTPVPFPSRKFRCLGLIQGLNNKHSLFLPSLVKFFEKENKLNKAKKSTHENLSASGWRGAEGKATYNLFLQTS